MEKTKLTSRKNLFKNFVGVDELHFDLPDRNESIRRFVVTRPDAAAIVIHNISRNTVVLIKQFRAPVFTKEDDGNILEVPAGVLEKGESPKECIIREALEETGYKIENPIELSTFYPSCGLLNERIALFYASVTNEQKLTRGGGLDTEQEYLEVLEIPVNDAFNMLKNGELTDAKTMLGIFYLNDLLAEK